MSIKFDVSRLNGIIADSKAKSGGGDGERKNFTNIGYLPQGTHKVRIFIDPTQELMRKIRYHQFNGKKTLCPDQLNRENSRSPKDENGVSEWAKYVQSLDPNWKEQGLTELPKCEIDEAAKEINSWKSGLGLKYGILVYMSVYESTATSDFWKADKQSGVPYAVLGKGKLEAAILTMLETLAADSPDYIVQMLNPSISGGMISMTVTGGTQGSVSLTVIPGAMKPAIFDSATPPEWWRPLDEVFLPKGKFNPKAYDDALTVARDKLKEHRDKIAKGIKTDAEIEAEEEAAKKAAEEAKNGTAPANTESTSQTTNTSVETPAAAPVVAAESTPAVTTPPVEEKAPVVEQKPIETAPVSAPVDSGLGANQVKMKMGRVIDLPQYAVEQGCWTKYNPANVQCMTCPVNVECMTEQSAR